MATLWLPVGLLVIIFHSEALGISDALIPVYRKVKE